MHVTKLALAAALFLGLAACSRNQPNLGANFVGAGDRDGPVTPGSQREFAVKVGDTVYFTTDQVEVSSEAQGVLQQQARWLSRYSQYPITIEGHADERGTREYNIALGARRADAVKRFLVAQGIQPSRIRTVSFGKERPVSVCDDISCWSQNRRAQTTLGGGAGGPTAGY